MEIFYCYSNLAFTNLWVVDLAEPANFLMVVLYYFMVRSKLEDSPIKVSILHFLPFLAYLIFMLFHFYFKRAPIKYSAYVDAYHPDILNFFWEENKPYWIIWVRKYKDVIMVVQIIIYLVSLIFYLRKKLIQKKLTWLQAEGNLLWALQSLILIFLLTLLFISVKILFQNDKGDFITGLFIAAIIYTQSFYNLTKGMSFSKEKSKKILIPHEQATLQIERLHHLMITQKPFIDTDFSLQSLAKMMDMSSHQMSQLLNENIGKNFAEYTAEYRIKEVMVLLKDPANDHLTIEAMAEMVGYLSKSTFNAAFKKQTGMTPRKYKIEG